MALMRLDKFLAQYSSCTRSEVKKILKQQNVTVNGVQEKRAERKVDPEQDVISLNGKVLAYQPFVCLMFHKPAGCVTATEDKRQKTVMDYIDHPRKKELFPAGRLDIDTEGLLLLMNDGNLAHRMLSPKHHVEKTYFVRAAGRVTEEDIRALETGVDIGEKTLTLPAKAELLRVSEKCDTINGSEYETVSEVNLTICEGKFHQVKRMFEARGKKVIYLKRISMAGLKLDESLPAGQWRELTEEEMELLNL